MASSSFKKSNHSQRLLCNGRNSIVTHGFFLFKKTQPQSIIIVEWTRQYSHARDLYSVRKHNHSQSLLWNGRDSIVTLRFFTLLENTTTATHFYYNLLCSIVKHRKENHSNSFYYNLLYSIRGGSRICD